MAKMIQCIKLGREAEAMDRAPLPGALGQKILENVSKEAWQLWLKHQTMLINENRLSMMDPKSREFLQAELQKYFFEGGSALPQGFVPKN